MKAIQQVAFDHKTLSVALLVAAMTTVYPSIIDPEIGANDFRISNMGPEGNAAFEGSDAAIAYNSINNEYLVVWEGDDDSGDLVEGEFEIFGQRIDAATGARIGARIRISDMGPDGNPSFFGENQSVAYNSIDNEYLVVWEGEDDTPPLVDGEREIFGQRINAATGEEVGANDFRISDMGPNGSTGFRALDPSVAYNSIDNEYLVVWEGSDDTGTLVSGEFEIFGQRLNAATGEEVGANDFRLSDMGPDGNTDFSAHCPVVAYNSTNNEYLVAWEGIDIRGFLAAGEPEIFGQRLDAAGAELGDNDVRISVTRTDADSTFEARDPALAYNNAGNEYLVVWEATGALESLASGEFEIFGQRIHAASGEAIGHNFRISKMGSDGDASFDAENPSVAYNAASHEYLVVWFGDDNTPPLTNNENEIFGQRLGAAFDSETDEDHFRISDMGPDGNDLFDAFDPVVAFNGTNNEYLVVWHGDDDAGLLADDEFEIYGQRLKTAQDEPPEPQEPQDFVFVAQREIKVNGQSHSAGDIHSNGDIIFGKGNPSLHTGNLSAVGNIEIKNGNIIDGDVTAGGQLRLDEGVRITGTAVGNATVASVSFPQLRFSAGGRDLHFRKNSEQTLRPDSYGKVHVDKESRLILRSGDYYFEELQFAKDVVLVIDVSNGPVSVNIVEKLSFDKDTRVEITPFDSRQVTFNILRHSDVKIDKGSVIIGSIVAPNAKVKFSKEVNFKGQIFADVIEFDKDGIFEAHNSADDNGNIESLTAISPAENDHSAVTQTFRMEQNYPNPFNSETTIRFHLDEPGSVSLKIYNTRGQEIRTLMETQVLPGAHTVSWDGRNQNGNPVASGLYFYKLQVGHSFQIKKMNLLR